MHKSILILTCLLLPLFADSFKYVAHRGDYWNAPEGSAAAYRLAVEFKNDIMKMDVQRTKDGVIVMAHDPSLKRTMDWDVKIKEVTYDEIRNHGPFKPVGDFKDEHITTFKEAIAIAKDIPEIWIDTKFFSPDFMETVLKQAADAGVTHDRIMIATFARHAIAYMKEKHPDIRRVLHLNVRPVSGKYKMSGLTELLDTKEDVVKQILALKETYGLFGVNIPMMNFADADVIKALHDGGLWVSVWYVNRQTDAKKFRDAGADAIVTRGASQVRIP
ncbi:MAG: hypothetical protein IJJ26_03760 [Victivallales bacterium]|nr:hypothetical protein [Victivallales bacterium]